MEEPQHIPNKRVQALVKLLEDPSDIVYRAVYHALIKEDVAVVPALLRAWDNVDDENVRQRIDNIIHHIEYKAVGREMAQWVEDGADDLLYGAYLVAKYQYSDLEYSTVRNAVNDIWRQIDGEVSKQEMPRDKVKVIDDYLFGKVGLKKNYDEPASHRNNCINDVLETLRGNHVTLSILYASICQRAGMPVYCISLPKIVIVCYLSEEADMDDVDVNDVLFYINPASEGRLLNVSDVTTFLDQYNLERDRSYYVPCGNIEIVRRLLTNMMYAFEMIECTDKSKEVSKLIDLIDQSADNSK